MKNSPSNVDLYVDLYMTSELPTNDLKLHSSTRPQDCNPWKLLYSQLSLGINGGQGKCTPHFGTYSVLLALPSFKVLSHLCSITPVRVRTFHENIRMNKSSMPGLQTHVVERPTGAVPSCLMLTTFLQTHTGLLLSRTDLALGTLITRFNVANIPKS